jgi:hypothetical protein
MPNMAVEITRKAKWYHVTTLRRRVRVTSRARVTKQTRNRTA